MVQVVGLTVNATAQQDRGLYAVPVLGHLQDVILYVYV